MVEAKNASFKFKSFKIPSFSYKESEIDDAVLKLNFIPGGKYLQKEGVFELVLELFGHEENESNKQVIYVKCISCFEFEPNLPFEDIPNYFYKNAIAVVFPFIRSFVSSLTLQANSTLLLLGLMNLSNLEVPLKNNTESE